MNSDTNPILVLGAGINGAAIARELALNGAGVALVDTADISFGTTAYSSRLVHGGLRYLEHGEFDLVRESLAERSRLLRLAPQFVRPLQLFIPVENRWGGFLAAAARFLHWPASLAASTPARGAWLVRTGLWMYDTYARDPSLPRHATHRLGSAGSPPVDPQRFVALCSYYDAQLRFPERFTLALLEDARRVAAENGTEFRVFTYHQARLAEGTVTLSPTLPPTVGAENSSPPVTFQPAAIVNATGAWVDATLARLGVASKPLIGGTRGSHFITSQHRVRAQLGDSGIYAEAPDGRPVFILPFGDGTLVGTTDLPYSGDPAAAAATPEELDYLLETANRILPEARLTRDDIDMHYCGVRPLPHVDSSSPAAITRRHWMEEHPGASPPLFSVIGGKLTTCRSLAEESAGTILNRLGLPKRADSRERPLPGAEAYPLDPAARQAEWERLARRFGVSTAAIERIAALVGTRLVPILSSLPDTAAGDPRQVALLAGTPLPKSFAHWMIENEWTATLDDLVERRLMLVFDGELTINCLRELAELLVVAGKLNAENSASAVAATAERLRVHFGKRLS